MLASGPSFEIGELAHLMTVKLDIEDDRSRHRSGFRSLRHLFLAFLLLFSTVGSGGAVGPSDFDWRHLCASGDEVKAVICLWADPDGWVWVGTDPGGVLLIDPARRIYHLKDRYGWDLPPVTAVAYTTGGAMWFGTAVGLWHRQPGGDIPQPDLTWTEGGVKAAAVLNDIPIILASSGKAFRAAGTDWQLVADDVEALAANDDGSAVVLGLRHGGLRLLSIDGVPGETIPLPSGSSGAVTAVASVDDEGWAVGSGRRIDIWRDDGWVPLTQALPESAGLVTCLAALPPSFIGAGTETGALWLWDSADGSWNQLPAGDNYLPTNGITALAGTRSEMFAGTKQGIAAIHYRKLSPVSVTEVTEFCGNWTGEPQALELELPRDYLSSLDWSAVGVHLADTVSGDAFYEVGYQAGGRSVLRVEGNFNSAAARITQVRSGKLQGYFPLDLVTWSGSYPGGFPEFIVATLVPAPGVPSRDPAIAALVDEILPPNLRGDMIKSALWLALHPILELPEQEFQTRFGALLGEGPVPRLRLAAAMLRSLAIPVRFVRHLNQEWMGEMWLINSGWVPFTTGGRAIDIGDPARPEAPAMLSSAKDFAQYSEGALSASVSPLNPKTGKWQQCSPSDLDFSDCQFLLVHPSTAETVPKRSRLVLSPKVTAFVRDTGDDYRIIMFGPGDIKIMEVPIFGWGSAQSLQMPGEFAMQILPLHAGDWIVLRVLAWTLLNPEHSVLPDIPEKPEVENS